MLLKSKRSEHRGAAVWETDRDVLWGFAPCCQENSCAEGALDCGSSSYRFSLSRDGNLPYEPQAEGGGCCYRRRKAVAAATALQDASRIFIVRGAGIETEPVLGTAPLTCEGERVRLRPPHPHDLQSVGPPARPRW